MMGVVTAVQIEGADDVSFRIPGIFASIPKEVAIRIADVTPMLASAANSTGSTSIGELVFLQTDDRPVVLNARYDSDKEASTITDAVSALGFGRWRIIFDAACARLLACTPQEFDALCEETPPSLKSTMNATMGTLQFHVTVIPLVAFVRERLSSNPEIILGVTLSSSITTFVLVALAAIFFRNYHIMKAKRILVMEREKWVEVAQCFAAVLVFSFGAVIPVVHAHATEL
jgi:hypothetical protein